MTIKQIVSNFSKFKKGKNWKDVINELINIAEKENIPFICLGTNTLARGYYFVHKGVTPVGADCLEDCLNEFKLKKVQNIAIIDIKNMRVCIGTLIDTNYAFTDWIPLGVWIESGEPEEVKELEAKVEESKKAKEIEELKEHIVKGVEKIEKINVPAIKIIVKNKNLDIEKLKEIINKYNVSSYVTAVLRFKPLKKTINIEELPELINQFNDILDELELIIFPL